MRLLLPALLLALSPLALPTTTLADPIVPGPDTTVFTEPVRDDGTIDYLAAINQRGLERTQHGNAFFAMDALLTDADWSTPQFRAQVYRILGQPVPANPNPQPFWDSNEIPEDINKAQREPWSPEDWPALNAWLDERKETLDAWAVITATQDPYFFPMAAEAETPGSLFDCLLPNLGQFRSLGRATICRANRSLAQGNPQAAWQDARTVLRSGRLLGENEGTLFDKLVAISLYRLAHPTFAHILGHPDTDAVLAQHIAAELNTLPEPVWVADAVDHSERFCALDIMAQLATGRYSVMQFLENRPANTPHRQPNLTEVEGFDPNVALRQINDWYDHTVTVASEPDWHTRLAEAERLDAQITAWHNEFQSELAQVIRAMRRPHDDDGPLLTNHAGTLILGIVTPAMAAAVRTESQIIAFHRLTRVATAVCLYRLTRGQLPESLDDLRAEHPELDLIDPFTDGQTFGYLHNASGFTVYSVNTDLDDDRGRPWDDEEVRADENDEGDLTFVVTFAAEATPPGH